MSRAACTLTEAQRALSDNRELYFEQSAMTRNGIVPRISPWRTSPACQRAAIESHPLSVTVREMEEIFDANIAGPSINELFNQGESSSDARARHS